MKVESSMEVLWRAIETIMSLNAGCDILSRVSLVTLSVLLKVAVVDNL